MNTKEIVEKQDIEGKSCDIGRQNRNSSIELFRIITMLCIIAHHYIVNSGIQEEITRENILTWNSQFSLIYGWGGKTGINCFVLITGYYMCKSKIHIKKFLKLLMEIEFYIILFYFIFTYKGYISFSFWGFLQRIIVIYGLGKSFVESYLAFYLFIPYLNLLIKNMREEQHLILIALCLFYGMILQTFLLAPAAFTYIGWFMVLYFIASYIRLYPKKIFEDQKICLVFLFISLLLSWASIIVNSWMYAKQGKITISIYHYLDVNRFLAVTTAVSAFLVFKNLRLKYHPVINKFAASTFGVLLIHGNCEAMRQWLWRDVLRNIQAYHSNYLVFHAIISVIAVYVICSLIDMARIQTLEKLFSPRSTVINKIECLIKRFKI